MSKRRIDVHHHILPPAYSSWLRAQGFSAAGGRELPDWSVEETLRMMDEREIEKAIMSVSAPGVHPDPSKRDDDAGRAMARQVNEFTARVVEQHPTRFGFFAMLPLPDVDGALRELEHAFDRLGADGVVVLGSTHGEYIGSPQHDELFAELERRRAVVFVHPNVPLGPSVPGIPPFAADFLLDTTRAAYRLVQREVPRRFPNVRIILSHAGGFVPYTSYRLAVAQTADGRRALPELLEDFRSFYFDTAISGTPAALPSLLAFAKPGHVLFGSDWPFFPAPAIAGFTAMLDAYPGLDAAGHAAIDRNNAARLFEEDA